MQVTVWKILSLVIAVGFAVVCAVEGGLAGLGRSAVLLLPLALIWFPEEIGSATGYFADMMEVDKPTPAFLISFMGWFLLVGLPAVLYFFG